MTDVLGIMDTLLLALQMENVLFNDINIYILEVTSDTFERMSNTTFTAQFTNILVPRSSYYTSYHKYFDVISNFQAQTIN